MRVGAAAHSRNRREGRENRLFSRRGQGFSPNECPIRRKRMDYLRDTALIQMLEVECRGGRNRLGENSIGRDEIEYLFLTGPPRK